MFRPDNLEPRAFEAVNVLFSLFLRGIVVLVAPPHTLPRGLAPAQVIAWICASCIRIPLSPPGQGEQQWQTQEVLPIQHGALPMPTLFSLSFIGSLPR